MSLLERANEMLSKKYSNTSSYKASSSIIKTYLRKNKQWNDLSTQGEDILNDILKSSKSLETKRKLIYIFALLIEENPAGLENIHKQYIEEYKKLKKRIIENAKENKPKNAKEARCMKVTLAEMRNREINMNDMDQRSLLYNILVFIDETPRLELRKVVYSPRTRLPNGNYFRCFNNKCELVLNDYKTSKTYKEWRINITGLLKDYLKKYIKHHKITPGDLLFINKKGNEYPANKFSEYIQRMFKNKLGVIITINCLRKIKENELFHKNPEILNMSTKDKEEYVKDKFKHNLDTSMTYYNIKKEDDDSAPPGFIKELQELKKKYNID